jgi:hypothetical protein
MPLPTHIEARFLPPLEVGSDEGDDDVAEKVRRVMEDVPKPEAAALRGNSDCVNSPARGDVVKQRTAEDRVSKRSFNDDLSHRPPVP